MFFLLVNFVPSFGRSSAAVIKLDKLADMIKQYLLKWSGVSSSSTSFAPC